MAYEKEFGGSGNGDTSVGAQVGTDYIVHLAKSGACTANGVTLGTGVGGTSPRNDYLFCMNDNGTAKWHSKSRVYYCRVGSGSTAVADMKPYRKADGTICFFDSVRNKYLTPNTGALAWTFACTVDGTALCAHDGRLTDELFGDYAEVRKVSSRTLNAAGIASYPAALTLKSGRFALNDGEAKAVTVAGALKLHGDMRIDLDVGASACDRFAVGSLVFDESASAAHPVVICVTGLGIDALPEGASLPLVTGANLALTDADAQRFQVAGMTTRVAVRDGALVLEPIPVVADAYWTGSAADDNWSSFENWRNREMPMRGATVTFGETAGGSSRQDLGAFAVDQVVFGVGCGAYTLIGNDVFTVGKGISNASASAQTFTLPMALGEADEPFVVETAGDLNLTEGVKTLAGSELVKGGAGTLVLNDDTLAAAAKVTVTNGTLKLNNTGRVTAAAIATGAGSPTRRSTRPLT